MQTVILFFDRALKFGIGGKTDQGINCPWPKGQILEVPICRAHNTYAEDGISILTMQVSILKQISIVYGNREDFLYFSLLKFSITTLSKE